MRTAIVMVGLIASLNATAAFAGEQESERQIKMKDGSTLVIFADGKMAMRDRKGLPSSMPENQTMEAEDGSRIVMKSNEVFRKTLREQELDRLYFGGG